MAMFAKSKNKMPDIKLEDFPFICRICLSRGDLRSLDENGYLRNLFEIITKIDVHSAASLPDNICSDCIKTLEDISLFINISMCNNAKAGKNFMLKNENEHSEATECETSLEQVIQSEKIVIEEYEEDLQYFKKGFEICRICYSTNILKPVEGKTHLMQLFQNITNIDVKAEVFFSSRNCICNKCIKKLETISVFISESLCNEIKLKNIIEANEAPETENYLEENAIDIAYLNKVKRDIGFDNNAHSYDSKSLRTSIDIKEEVVDSPEASIEQINSEESPFKDEFSTWPHLKNLLKGCDASLESHSETNRFKCDDNDFDKNAHSYDSKSLHTSIDIKEDIVDSSEESIKQINSEENPFIDEFSTGPHLKNMLKGFDTNLESHSETNRFKCNGGNKILTEKQSIKGHVYNHTGEEQRHMLIRTGEKRFTCDCCENSFTRKSQLRRHMRIHTGEKPFTCYCCDKSFTRKSSLQRHLLIHAGEKPFRCDCCEKKFIQKSHWQKHMRIHTGEKPFTCDCCEKSFIQKRTLQMHMRIHTGGKPFTCYCCEKSFTEKSRLQKHMLIHSREKPFTCDCCEKSFNTKSNLQTHMRIHTGVKPFTCDCCEKSFNTKSNLQNHMRIHTGEKPFTCHFCEKSFIRKADLKNHMRIHTGEKPFTCYICEKSFNQKAHLERHMRTHTVKIPFTCDCCGKIFNQKSTLQTHMLIHSREKPFTCDCCEKSFNTKSNLQRHMHIHTGEKPFTCNCCEKSFTQKSSLQTHMLIHAGEK